MATEVKSLTVFTHRGYPMWGVTTLTGSIVDNVMFSTKELAQGWLAKNGFKKPWKWNQSPFDLYSTFRKEF